MGIDFKAIVVLEGDDVPNPYDWREVSQFELGNFRMLRRVLTTEEINHYSGRKLIPAEAAIEWLTFGEMDTSWIEGAREYIRTLFNAGYKIQVFVCWS